MSNEKLLTGQLPPIVENIPAVVFRLSHKEESRSTWFVTRNISMYGYNAQDFMDDKIRCFDIGHPDARVLPK